MSSARTVFAWAIFPVVLGGAVAFTIWQIERGVDPTIAFVGPTVAAYFLLLTLERLLPYHRSWNRSRGDLHVDLGHLVVSGAFTVELLRPLMLALGIWAGAWLSASLGVEIWPQEWPLVVQLVLALVLGEFFMYWAHRLGHSW